MKVNKDYINTNKVPSGYIHLYENNTNILIKDCFKLEFITLYPNIIVSLYKEGYFKDIPKDKILILENYIYNRDYYKSDENLWIEYKLFVYGFYSDFIKTTSNQSIITHYLDKFYSEILVKADIIYIDTDFIIYNNIPLNMVDELELKYIITKIRYCYFVRAKQYITVDENENFIIKGRANLTNTGERIIKAHIREDRINEILNEKN
jgi:hypothetical protein